MLKGRRFEDIEVMKEAVMSSLNTFTLQDFHGTFRTLLKRYNKCIAFGGFFFEGD